MTRLYGVLGYPIGHSMSPLMHNDAFSHHDIEGHYTAFAVKPENLADAIKGIRALNISGCNVTTPHKVEIMNYLDEIDEVARGIGAVNTVVNQDGKLIGYNTDGIGFITALEEISGPLKGKNILLIGAGGACRAIYFTLASLGVSNVDITNRTVEKAVELSASCPYETSGKTMTITEAEKLLAKYDIIVNTTTVGMYPKIEETPISVENLGSHCIVSDIIYNPLQTKLLREAQAKGTTIQNGIGMFVYQAALAFEKWTDKMPDVARMTKIVETQLGGNKTC